MQKTSLFFIAIFLVSVCSAQLPTEHLSLWLSADSVEIISGKVAKWHDQSGTNYSPIQTIAENSPIKIDDILAGKPIIHFNGNNWLKYQYPTAIIQPISVFVIWRITTAGNQACYGNYETSIFDFQSYNSKLQIYANSILGYSKSAPFDFILNSNIYNGIASKIFENGLLKATGNSGSGSMNGITIGAVYNNTWQLNGDIAEVIMYDTVLSDINRKVVENYLMDKYSPTLDLGADICNEVSVLSIDNNFTDILWSNGETSNSCTITETGQYFVQAKDNFGRMRFDTINAIFYDFSISDQIICSNDSVLLTSGLNSDYEHLWSTTETSDTIFISEQDNYWLQLTDSNGCVLKKYFSVFVDSLEYKISLGNDTSLCSGNSISLITGENLCNEFLWTPGGSTQPFQMVYDDGWQKLNVVDFVGCTAVDSIYVTITGMAPTPGYFIQNLCFGETTQFIDNSTPSDDISSWKWVINSKDTLYTQNAEMLFTDIGIQNIELIVTTYTGCSNNVFFNITIKDVPDVNFSHLPICSGLSTEFISSISIPASSTVESISWYVNDILISNDLNLTHTFISQGSYNVKLEVILDNSCSSVYTETINIPDSYPIPEAFYLISPIHQVNNLDINFDWSESRNASFYRLIISSDINFDNVLYSVDSIFSTNYNLNFVSISDTLFWKVIAYNPCGQSTTSETASFSYFSPSILSNLQLWLSADSVEIISGRVATWYDKSGNNYSPTQSSVSNRPTKINNALGRNPIIRFNGNNWLKYQFPTPKAQPVTIFALWDKTGGGSTPICLSNYSTSNFALFLNSTNNNIGISATFGTGFVSYPKSSLFNFVLNSAIFNNSTSKLYENGILKAFGDAGNNDCNGITIGASYNNDLCLIGNIAEIIIFDTVLTDYDRIKVENYLMYKYSPKLNLGGNININYGFADTLINAGEWFTNYVWSSSTGSLTDTETTQSITVNKSGTYSVTVTDIFGYESSDSLIVTYPKINTINDTTICLGDTLLWNTNLTNNYDFLWNKGSVDSILKITTTGEYYVKVTDSLGNFRLSDTITVSVDSFPAIASLGADTNLCAGNSIYLKNGIGETYLWSSSTGSLAGTDTTQEEIIVANSGDYYLTVTNNRACLAIDTVAINIVGIAPTTGFYFNTSCLGDTTFFTDNSYTTDGSNIVSYSWDLSNDNYSSVQNPNFLFPDTGSYQTSLTVTADNGCTNTKKQDLIIHPLPVINFSPDVACSNNNVVFSDNSFVHGSNIIYREWHIEDSIYINKENPTHNFNAAGQYPIILKSTSTYGCKNTETQNIEIKQSPKTDFDFTPACFGDSVYFSDNTETFLGSPISWQWNFGDEASSNVSNPSHLFNKTGNYLVTLTTKQLSNACSNSAEKQLIVYNKPLAYFNNKSICLYQDLQLIDSSTSIDGNITYWQWRIDTLGYSYTQNPNIVIKDTGSYHIKLKIKSETGCSDTISRSVFVHSLPIVNFDFNPKLGTPPLIVNFDNGSENASSYIWQFGDEQSNSDNNPSHTYANSGYYNIKLIGISEYGCIDSLSKKLKVIIPLNDIAVMDIRPVFNNNYLNLSADIANMGTLAASNFNLIVTTDNGNVFQETFDDELASGSVITYNFKTQIKFPLNTSPNFVCLKAELGGDLSDEKPENNEKCYSFKNSFMAFSPYPNPSKEKITFEYIIPYSHVAEIFIYNSMGEKVKTIFSGNANKGLNRITINTLHLGNGIFTILVIFDGQKTTKRFVNSSKQ
ncbi:MAG: PKD domain-containing protein [Bacteroidetes bacterium]|nr:PKD domain-containing protein [Bacteroidota bacterium]